MNKKGVLYIGSVASKRGGKFGERQIKVPKSFVRELVRSYSKDILDHGDFKGHDAELSLKSWNFDALPLEVRQIGNLGNISEEWERYGNLGMDENPGEFRRDENHEEPKLAYKGNGKPYFYDLPMHFSISHTEHRSVDKSSYLWGCVVSDLEVGLDLQWGRPASYMDIANRHFTKNEISYVEENGSGGFFALWTRREAVGKAIGLGLSMGKTDFPGTVTPDGDFAPHIDAIGKHLEIHTARITENLWGSCCFVVGKEG